MDFWRGRWGVQSLQLSYTREDLVRACSRWDPPAVRMYGVCLASRTISGHRGCHGAAPEAQEEQQRGGHVWGLRRRHGFCTHDQYGIDKSWVLLQPKLVQDAGGPDGG